MNKSSTGNTISLFEVSKSGTITSVQQQKIYEAYESLKNNADVYWQTLEGLSNEQKVDIFIRILRKELPENRSEFQLKFLSQNISQNYGDQVVRNCVRFLRYEDLQSDQILFEQGERGTRFYIILQGSVHILIKLPEKGNVRKFKNQRINTIHAGKAFGEVALMNDNTMRTATIKSAEFCRFAYLEKEDFKNIIGKEATEQINQRYMFIKDYNFFDEFTYRELMTFSYHFNETTYKRGEIVYDIQDKKIDDIFFVKEGSFMLQGSFDITQSNIPNLKVKRQHRTFNIDLLVERSIFGLEYFNKQVLKDTHYYIKYLEEMSSSAAESQSQTPSNGQSTNTQNVGEADKQIPFQPYRISRVICDSTRGTIYRVKASEIEQRLWKEDSKQKWNALSQVIFEKQVQKIKQFIEKSLEDKSHMELIREQDKYLKPPIEYLGKKDELKHLFDSDNPTQMNSQAHLTNKQAESIKQLDSFQLKSSPSLLRNIAGSPMNNHISLIMDMDKFFKSSIEFGFSEKSPFNQSIQKTKQNYNTSPSLSPVKIKSFIQPCLVSSQKQSPDVSPRKGKNVTIFDLNKQESIFSPSTKKNNKGFGTSTSLGRGYSNNHKTFSLCVFNADYNGSSLILGKKKQNSSLIIQEEEDHSDKNYGSSLILSKKQSPSPRRLGLQKTNSVLSFHSNEELLEHQRRLDLQQLQDDEENEQERLLKQKKSLKQCSPPKKSPESQKIYEQKEILKSEKKFKKDFIRKVEKMCKNEQKIKSNQSTVNSNQQKQQLAEQPKEPAEILNKVFYFAHNYNNMVKREQEVNQFKKQFLGEDPDENNPSNVIRGNTDGSKSFYDQDLLQATTLDDYKRRKYQRKLVEEQDNKFQKLFSNDLVELGKISESSQYSKKVKDLYKKNRKENKIIFDKTAEIVKQQNCSYNQVREYFYKQDHKDRFFQDIFINKAKQLTSKNANNNSTISSKVNNDQANNEDVDQSYISKTQSNQTGTLTPVPSSNQQNQSTKKTSFSSASPNKRKTLVLKEKRVIQNNNNFINSNITQASASAFEVGADNLVNLLKDVSQVQFQDEIISQYKDSGQYEREIEMLQQRPDYLTYLLQKNQTSNQDHIERAFGSISQIKTPMVIQTAGNNESEQEYYINSALKIHKALQQQDLENQEVQQFEIDKVIRNQEHINNKMKRIVYAKTEVDQEDEEYNNFKPEISEDYDIRALKQTDGTPRLSQNHLVHLKYTPTYNKNILKTPFSQTAYTQFNNISKENFSQTTTNFNPSSTQGQQQKSLLETSTLKKQTLSPNILDNSVRYNNRSYIYQKSPNNASHLLNVSFSNSQQKQELNTSTKNTFLSQNHRKQIVDQRIKQRDIFLRSKSSVKRYSQASTNYPEANLLPQQIQQIDVNSKCLAQIPGWNHRPSTSQSIKSHKKHQNKLRIQPRSLQIVSCSTPNTGMKDQRVMTTMSVYDNTPNKRNNFSIDDNSSSPFLNTQQSLRLNTSQF